METRHFSNHNYSIRSPVVVKIISAAFCFTVISLFFVGNLAQGAVLVLSVITLGCVAYYLLMKSRVSFTFTATHIQQHLAKGGWVLKWENIEKIGLCHYQKEGWQKPLPWIGIKIRDYEPYLDSICPRIATDILLDQRALLYVGFQQQAPSQPFEDIVLDSTPYQSPHHLYRGLVAMLANRMRHQRSFFDYDIYIAETDLAGNAEDFVGLARRYLAAAERTQP
ncbi:DUF2982 domain-containing protein [Vibrio hippocampi]|nr:DUF2982 domain-containing protein [Vibrio hippocampi]